MSLTISEMEEKIKKVDDDISQLRLTGDSSRKLEVLTEYREWLNEELGMMKREQRLKK